MLSRIVVRIGLFLSALTPVAAWAQEGTAYQQSNLVSNSPGVASFTDSNLVNSWGLVIGESGILGVADNGSSRFTVYAANGTPQQASISIPGPGNQGQGTPTGVVRNRGSDFVVTNQSKSGPARLLFATEDGTIAAWSPQVSSTQAFIAVDRSATGAVYKGLALARTDTRELLFAADFHNNRVDAFDQSFAPAFSFSAPADAIPSGYAPFNIRYIGKQLYVTYAKQSPPDNKDDQAGPSNGFVVIFDLTGKLVKVFASHGPLNSPWGLAVAPASFGVFSNSLLVGNFGDGHINAYDLGSGQLLGALSDASGNPLVIDGLWSLGFGLPKAQAAEDFGSDSIPADTLYFTAGPNQEAGGLLGTISVAPASVQ